MKVDGEGWTRRLGATGLDVTAVSLGGGPLGSMPAVFGHEVGRDQAVDLVTAALTSPVRVIDTANQYSDGESERRIGAGLARAGGLPAGYLVVTKVDARDGDFSGERVRASVAESKARLGLEHLPLVHLHDPEFHDHRVLMGRGGAVEALVRLRDEGQIDHIGVAGGDTRVLARYLDLGVFEVVLVHSRWSLVDRSATGLIERAAGEGLGVLNAAVYGGGLLADPMRRPATYGYRPAREQTIEAVDAMSAVCRRFGTDLATAALQFSLRTALIDSTVVGISSRARLAELLDAATADLPDALWAEIDALVPPAEHWLDHA